MGPRALFGGKKDGEVTARLAAYTADPLAAKIVSEKDAGLVTQSWEGSPPGSKVALQEADGCVACREVATPSATWATSLRT